MKCLALFFVGIAVSAVGVTGFSSSSQVGKFVSQHEAQQVMGATCFKQVGDEDDKIKYCHANCGWTQLFPPMIQDDHGKERAPARQCADVPGCNASAALSPADDCYPSQ